MNVRNSLVYTIGIFTILFTPILVSAQTVEEMAKILQDAQSLLSQKPAPAASTLSTSSVDRLNQNINNFVNIQLEAIPTPAEIKTSAIKDNLSITTTPTTPGPNEDVRVSIVSYLTSLDKAMIIWTLNGTTIKQGVGEKFVTFKNGGPGSTTVLRVSITTNTGEKVNKELFFNPVGVTILWEADTYTPPFYKGKALMSPQARVRAVAIPDIANAKDALSPENLVFLWKYNGASDAAASGYGKNSFTFTGSKPYEVSDVRVRVSSTNDAISSEMKVVIPLSYPFVLFYENHPLLGVWYARPFGSKISLSKAELSISAEPYFFSNETIGVSEYRYSWTLNNSEVQTSGKVIVLRNDVGTKGVSNISLGIQGLKKTFQAASRSLSIDFTENTSVQKIF